MPAHCVTQLLSLASICSSLAEEAGAFKAKCHLERGLEAERKGEGHSSCIGNGTERERGETGLSNDDVLVHFPGAFASFCTKQNVKCK